MLQSGSETVIPFAHKSLSSLYRALFRVLGVAKTAIDFVTVRSQAGFTIGSSPTKCTFGKFALNSEMAFVVAVLQAITIASHFASIRGCMAVVVSEMISAF